MRFESTLGGLRLCSCGFNRQAPELQSLNLELLLNQSLETTVRKLSTNQLDDLSEALLDFGSSADLDRWLMDRSNV